MQNRLDLTVSLLTYKTAKPLMIPIHGDQPGLFEYDFSKHKATSKCKFRSLIEVPLQWGNEPPILLQKM